MRSVAPIVYADLTSSSLLPGFAAAAFHTLQNLSSPLFLLHSHVSPLSEQTFTAVNIAFATRSWCFDTPPFNHHRNSSTSHLSSCTAVNHSNVRPPHRCSRSRRIRRQQRAHRQSYVLKDRLGPYSHRQLRQSLLTSSPHSKHRQWRHR